MIRTKGDRDPEVQQDKGHPRTSGFTTLRDDPSHEPNAALLGSSRPSSRPAWAARLRTRLPSAGTLDLREAEFIFSICVLERGMKGGTNMELT